ncbi:hypothetical protein CAEBREN_02187 [Caenorhabditis brenneri]|uniref:Uncharacterized protein n=1 Tax=Caenorhabditis brenneri TaxID=135651 RepID=G0P1L0_CAEBE|nr:hypothetical protein CAEBREN_02187 [Caenorhabditis brenneri]
MCGFGPRVTRQFEKMKKEKAHKKAKTDENRVAEKKSDKALTTAAACPTTVAEPVEKALNQSYRTIFSSPSQLYNQF